jgi:ubiquinone/menaquinone biosynthesis C-methylase UbiE
MTKLFNRALELKMMENDVKEWLRRDGESFLKNIGIKESHVVLDFGCGVGHYTIPAAKVVGEEGKVFAIDKDKEALDGLMERAKLDGLKNIKRIEISGELKITLEEESVDVALLYDVLHYIKERKTVFDEVYRILKPGALLSVYPKHHKSDDPLWTFANMELEDIIKEIERAGFCFERKAFKKLIHDDNYDEGYILSFRKKRGNCSHR